MPDRLSERSLKRNASNNDLVLQDVVRCLESEEKVSNFCVLVSGFGFESLQSGKVSVNGMAKFDRKVDLKSATLAHAV